MITEIFNTGKIYLIRTPVSGNCGIPKLHGLILGGTLGLDFNPATSLEESYFVFVTRNFKYLLILHLDEVGITLIKRVLFNRRFRIMLEDEAKPLNLTREQMKRLVLDGTYQGEWYSTYMQQIMGKSLLTN